MQISSQRLQSAAMPPASATPRVSAPSSSPTRGSAASDEAPKAAPNDMPEGPSKDQRTSSLARLDGFQDAMMERLSMAAKDAPADEVSSFRDAAASLESGLARLRAGLENGTLQSGDIQRGVENAFQGAREILDAGRSMSSGGDSAQATRSSEALPEQPNDIGATVRERFSGFADTVMARIGGLDIPDREAKAMADATAEAFASATSRLDAALFNPESGEPIDRGTFQTLYSEALSSLQQQLGDLLGGGSEDSGVIYDARRSAEGLSAVNSSIDLAG